MIKEKLLIELFTITLIAFPVFYFFAFTSPFKNFNLFTFTKDVTFTHYSVFTISNR